MRKLLIGLVMLAACASGIEVKSPAPLERAPEVYMFQSERGDVFVVVANRGPREVMVAIACVEEGDPPGLEPTEIAGIRVPVGDRRSYRQRPGTLCSLRRWSVVETYR